MLFRLLTLLLCAALCARAVSADADPLVKIGVSAPLTGSAANFGNDIRNALEFAAERYGHGRYQLIIEDDKCDGKTAVTVAQKLTRIDRVRYVIGYGCSGALLAAAPIYNRSKTVAIGVYTSSPRLSSAGEYIFRTCPSDIFAVHPLREHQLQRYRRIGGLFEETEYAQDFRAAFERENADKRLTLVNENFLSTASDLRTTLVKLRASGVEALLLVPQAEDKLALLVQEIRALNWDVPLYSHVFPGSPAFLNAVGRAAEGIIFTDLPQLDDAASEEGRRWYRDFVARYGEPQSGNMTFVTSVAAFAALHQAIQDRADAAAYLKSHEFHSALDAYRFTSTGDIEGLNYVLKIIRGGKPELLSAPSAAAPRR